MRIPKVLAFYLIFGAEGVFQRAFSLFIKVKMKHENCQPADNHHLYVSVAEEYLGRRLRAVINQNKLQIPKHREYHKEYRIKNPLVKALLNLRREGEHHIADHGERTAESQNSVCKGQIIAV